MIAAIPFLFAAQQLIEGLQWLVEKPSTASSLCTYGFLTFAFLLWPIYVPVAVYMNERNAKRRTYLRVFCLAGGVLVLALLGVLLSGPIQASAYGGSIRYHLNSTANIGLMIWYVLVILGSFFCSSDKLVRLFGLLTALSVLVSVLFYSWVFTSVWCFFAAALSILMYVYLRLTPPRNSRVRHG